MEERLINNDDVPVETLFKWQSREMYKLRHQLEQKEKTIRKLRNNITMLLRDPEVKLQVARELIIRERNSELRKLQKEIHRMRQSERKIIGTLLKYKLKENEQST
jgi:hypothetical protein